MITPKMLTRWKVFAIGSGSFKSDVEALLKIWGLIGNVIIKDLIHYVEMPLYYAAVDLSFLPTLMGCNSLSVVEAGHSGLLIAWSNNAGNIHEGVTDCENCWLLPIEDRLKFMERLNEIFETDIDALKLKGKVSIE